MAASPELAERLGRPPSILQSLPSASRYGSSSPALALLSKCDSVEVTRAQRNKTTAVRRAILLLGSLACLVAVVGVVVAKLHPPFKWALQDLQPLCSEVLCLHFYARMWSIEYAIRRRGADPVYLAIGDSITEGAELAYLCGRKPINAGIGGATVETFATHARRLADLAKPD